MTPVVTAAPAAPIIAGLTTAASVAQSFGQLGQAARTALAQQQGLMRHLLFSNEPVSALGSQAGGFASAGSAVFGLRGRVALADGLALQVGLASASEGYANARLNGSIFGAASLRHTWNQAARFRPFAEVGGWFAPDASLRFTRTYANGVGFSTGSARTHGDLSYFFARAGFGYQVTPFDEVGVSGEIGQSHLRINRYSEALSAANPFPADVSGGSNRLALATARVQLTHQFDERIDATVGVGVTQGFASRTRISGNVVGVGVFNPIAGRNSAWMEYGARVGYRIAPDMRIDIFADGEVGGAEIGDKVHIGAGFLKQF